jgi:hypothetical protein
VRAFRLGEFIEVSGHFGRVSDMGLLHVEIQTEDRDLKTLPNILFVTNAVKRIRPSGTILSAHISLGYDVAPSRVKKLLVEAGKEIGLKDPFARVIDLGDHAISYKVAGLLEDVSKLLQKRSDLRMAMMHSLHTDGIEIVSPRFRNTRLLKKEQVFIPPADASTPPITPEASTEGMMFDKAREAASLDSLHKTHAELVKELETLRKAVKEDDGEGSEGGAIQVAQLEDRIARLAKRIQDRENDASEKD